MKNFYIFCARLLSVFGVKVWAVRVRTPAPFNNEIVLISYRTNDLKRHLRAVVGNGRVVAYPVTKRHATKLRQNENCFA